MASESPTRTPNGIVVFLGSAAAFAVVAVVFSWALGMKTPLNEVEQTRAAQRIETRTKLENEAQEKLGSEGWVDKAKGTVHVPIADAMAMVVADLTAKKPAPSSVKVEPPLPMPVGDPASKEPPPPALPSAPQGADTIRFAPPASAEAAPAPAVAPVAVPTTPLPSPAPEKPAEPASASPAPAAPAVPPAPAIPPAPAKPADPAPAAPAAPSTSDTPASAPLTNPTENPAPTK